MEINLQFEIDLIYSKGQRKFGNFISRKYLSQLEKIYRDLYNLYVEQRVLMSNLERDGKTISPGEKRYFPTRSYYILLLNFSSFNGYIDVSIDGVEEKEYIDNLKKFLEIDIILYQIIFRTHPNKLKKFDRKKNIKVKIYLEGVKKPAIY